MQLTDLNPQFIGAGGEGIFRADGSPVPRRFGVGLMCDCPCGCGSSLYVPFRNPIDGGPPTDPDPKRAAWERTGIEFASLTLSPSIKRIPHDGSCGWHGHIKKGVISTCDDSTPATPEFIQRMKE